MWHFGTSICLRVCLLLFFASLLISILTLDLPSDKTTVIAAVYGPMPVSTRQEKIDRATIQVTFTPASGQSGDAEKHVAELIRGAVEAIVMSSLHPRTKISVAVQVVRDDGAVLATAINACCLALVNAGIQCNAMMSACAVAIAHNGSVLLDPTAKEEAVAEALVTLSFHSTSSGVLLSHTSGMLSDDAYLTALTAGEKACASVLAYFKLSLTKAIKKSVA